MVNPFVGSHGQSTCPSFAIPILFKYLKRELCRRLIRNSIICAEGLLRISYVHCFVSVYLIHVPPMSVKKDEYLVFCSLTFLLNIYMNIHITHTTDIVYSVFISKGGTIWIHVSHYKYSSHWKILLFFLFLYHPRRTNTDYYKVHGYGTQICATWCPCFDFYGHLCLFRIINNGSYQQQQKLL